MNLMRDNKSASRNDKLGVEVYDVERRVDTP